jgi:hypothetical protein
MRKGGSCGFKLVNNGIGQYVPQNLLTVLPLRFEIFFEFEFTTCIDTLIKTNKKTYAVRTSKLPVKLKRFCPCKLRHLGFEETE